jgi:ribosomal protein S18 acetylase RimI-like enzyme
MLGEAAVWRPDKPTPTAEQVMADPLYALYLAGWPRQGDYGLIAELDGPVGAAWYRTYTEANRGYGFVAEDVPELSIAVIASRRHEGIGRRLLIDLIEASAAQGCRALSLSVAENNPARGLYESAGFVPGREAWTLLHNGATCRSIKLRGPAGWSALMRRRENFIATDEPDAMMSIDYFVWAIRGPLDAAAPQVIVVDTRNGHRCRQPATGPQTPDPC